MQAFQIQFVMLYDKFDRDDKFIFAGCFANYESIVVNKVLDFHFDSM